MKYITFIRHAKSDWDNDLSDFDRPLNKRGFNDAPIIGKYINDHLQKVNLLISSPSLRTKQTSEIIAKEIHYPKENIIFYDELYHCSISEYIEILLKQNVKHHHICIVSHNPGTTGIINILSNSNIDNVPTCSFGHIKFDFFNWNEVEIGTGELLHFVTPKQISR